MTPAIAFLLLLVWVVVIGAAWLLIRPSVVTRRAGRRLFAPDAPTTPTVRSDEPEGLARWLYLAGYRADNAAIYFVIATIAMFMLGLAIAAAMVLSGAVPFGAVGVGQFRGASFDAVGLLLALIPVLIPLVFILVPTVLVRSARRRRVAKIERDLPIVLELMSTLAEAGLSFDAALDRVLRASSIDRPLTQELRMFQHEVFTGRSRTQSLRRLARRVEVSSLGMFVSAVVQAEQIGAGISSTLRQQAGDLRNRRREQALQFSMTLPVKALFPMVVCFLPGIFLFALGPSIFRLASSGMGFFGIGAPR